MQAANTRRLRDWLQARRGLVLEDYAALHRWSVEHVEDFWQSLWDYFGIVSPTPHARVLQDARMPGARWFEGAQVNYAGHLLRHVRNPPLPGAPAVVFRNEALQAEGRSIEIGWAELADRAAALAAALRAAGVQRGDRVAAYLPNNPQALIGLLACASIGAVWTLCAPDMGLATVSDRFGQVAPRVLIACDGTVYGGKTADRRSMLAGLLRELPSVQTLVLVPYLEQAGAPGSPFTFDAAGWPGDVLLWDEVLAGSARVVPEPLPFSHPLWIVYSSGTTGLPKPIVHGHGGVLLEMLKLHAFHLNLQPETEGGERFLWYSSSGWVMWNLSVSALLVGATVYLYDGHPAHPQPDTLWRFAADVKLSFLGAGAAYYTGCMKSGLVPREQMDLSHLRALGSTGSPLPPQAYEWGAAAVRPDIWWAVVSGGTDLASAFLGGTPELPTVPGEMQARCLGADVQAWDEQGREVHDDVGELVCAQPMPSMPLYFWGDADGVRYRDSYFDMYPGIWRHGDWLRITPSGSAIVYGRSDATLNRHGHRLGTSELYRVVEDIAQVLDSLVVDIEFLGRPGWMPLFVVLREGEVLDDGLREKIRQRIRQELSPRFVPDEVVQVQDVPRTLTGKKQELPVKKLMLGRRLEDVVNKDACANPQAFEWYAAYAREHLRAEEVAP